MSKLELILNKWVPYPTGELHEEIKSLFRELIGEDVPRDTTVSVQGKNNMTRRARNTLRAELRRKVEEL